jgi:hypothetical protein
VGKRAPKSYEETKSKKANKDDAENLGKHVLAPDQKYLITKLSEINPNIVYFLVYVREKSDADLAAEAKSSKESKVSDKGDYSIRMAL